MNLLPKEEKEILKNGFKMRFFIIGNIFFIVAFLVGTATLLPSFILAQDRLALISTLNSTNKNEDENSVKDILRVPKEIELKLKFIQSNSKSVSLIQTLNSVFSNMPKAIKIDSLSFNRQGENTKEKITIIISGIAGDRNSLVEFESVLKNNNLFKNVEVPVSSLAKDKDLPFSINLIILNEKLDS